MASLVASPPSTADVAEQAHGAVSLGDGRVRLGWPGPGAAGAGAAGAAGARGTRPQEAAGFGDANLARLVRLLLSEVVSEAAVSPLTKPE